MNKLFHYKVTPGVGHVKQIIFLYWRPKQYKNYQKKLQADQNEDI